ncbi:DNA-binding response regulator [Hahella sp. CCB-MM4]|uniref:response regulator transcription factor n=1 Tax=Hahella sp. (strain CCB-MM4) TaxID=1926491 RepID=UPI000B9AC2FA|nr:response regulator transcription factor [Hahella sp. CCB-MM4]OZG70704.1 DNA-binding response regulator [Hahella sp. CCB-MM4]
MKTTYASCDQVYHLLLVEDDEELSSLIQDYLHKNGFEVTCVRDGREAVGEISRLNPDLVILDVMLPGLSGMDVCRQARTFYSGLILMLTALDEDMDQMLGLELGADDYIIKPVQPRLLLTRIRAQLRRVQLTMETTGQVHTPTVGAGQTSSKTGVISVPPLTIDLRNRSVLLDGYPVDLTTAEFDLLHLLAQSPGEVVDRDTILQTLRGFDYDGLDRSIDRRVSRLRQKLLTDSEAAELIKTVRGKGYQLCVG